MVRRQWQTMYEITVNYTEGLVRASVRAVYGQIIRRAIDWKFVVALITTIGRLIVVHFHRGAFWLDGAVAVLLIFMVGIPVTLYKTRLRLSLDRLHRMKGQGWLRLLGQKVFRDKWTLSSAKIRYSLIGALSRTPLACIVA